ncbi:hypothetical protein MMC07_004634 [Pseudocyphellaria aurata]|nr:hypothetical protein [Pseudocyphellaria aurata]
MSASASLFTKSSNLCHSSSIALFIIISTIINYLSATTSASPTTISVRSRSGLDPQYYDCSDGQEAIVKEAWAEAGELADAHAKWEPPGWFHPGAWQAAQSMYLGSDSRKDKPLLGQGPLKLNIDRQHDIHFNAPRFTYAYFYCDERKVPTNKEPHGLLVCKDQPTLLAYTFNDIRTFWAAHYIVFCPAFFTNELSSLAQLVQSGQDNQKLAVIMDTWLPARARVIFHETYHWTVTVTWPPMDRLPEVYRPKDVYDLAKNENTKGAKTNAESWTEAAMAMYVQQTLKLRLPPVPREYAPTEMRSNPSIMRTGVKNFHSIALARMPDSFVPPVIKGAPASQPNKDQTNP